MSYFVGDDPRGWRTRLPAYSGVVYHEVWPGIDVAFTAPAGRLKYELRLRAGASPGDVRLAYSGASRLSVDALGNLRVATAGGVLTDERPTSYQRIDGRKIPVDSRFALRKGSYGFAIGSYDERYPLVIDPGLVYSTYLGAASFDGGLGIAVDAAGSSYVTGRTRSPAYPATAGSADASYNGGDDAFVAKLDPNGSGLVYAAFLGGSSLDEGRSVAVDAAGNVYLTGFTASADFPTRSALDASYNGGRDGFVVKIDASGSSVVYSTYLGGEGDDNALALALAADGSAFVAGETESASFPVTPGAVDRTANGDFDAFVTKLAPAGAVAYSTYLGGPGLDDALAIAVAANGNAYVTGKASAGYPATPSAYDTSQNGGLDAFVTQLSGDGSALVYSTYLGGDSWDEGLGIDLDDAGNAFVAGNVQSANFPTTSGVWDRSLSGEVDAFVAKLGPSGSGLGYSTFLGGTSWDEADGLVLDGSGDVYIAGHTASSDFPTTSGAFDETSNGEVDAFLTRVGPTGADLAYSTYVGGDGWDGAFALAVDGGGVAYLTGYTDSANFPTTSTSFDTTQNGDVDAFVTKIDPTVAPPPPPPSLDFTLSATPPSRQVVRGSAGSYAVTITPTNGFAGSVDLAVSGLPSATAATFTQNPATTSSTLEVSTSATSPVGSYQLTITGTSDGLTHSTTVMLDVQAPPAADFSLVAAPTSRSIVRGSSTTYSVTVVASGGFTGAVALSISGVPAGSAASFSPNPTTGSSTLTVTTSRSTKSASYTLTITGASSGLQRTTTATLNVSNK